MLAMETIVPVYFAVEDEALLSIYEQTRAASASQGSASAAEGRLWAGQVQAGAGRLPEQRPGRCRPACGQCVRWPQVSGAAVGSPGTTSAPKRLRPRPCRAGPRLRPAPSWPTPASPGVLHHHLEGSCGVSGTPRVGHWAAAGRAVLCPVGRWEGQLGSCRAWPARAGVRLAGSWPGEEGKRGADPRVARSGWAAAWQTGHHFATQRLRQEAGRCQASLGRIARTQNEKQAGAARGTALPACLALAPPRSHTEPGCGGRWGRGRSGTWPGSWGAPRWPCRSVGETRPPWPVAPAVPGKALWAHGAAFPRPCACRAGVSPRGLGGLLAWRRGVPGGWSRAAAGASCGSRELLGCQVRAGAWRCGSGWRAAWPAARQAHGHRPQGGLLGTGCPMVMSCGPMAVCEVSAVPKPWG